MKRMEVKHEIIHLLRRNQWMRVLTWQTIRPRPRPRPRSFD